MRTAKVQASLRIWAVSPEPSLLTHTSSESTGTFRQKVRSLAPLNGWAWAVEICHDGMLEDTNSLDGAQLIALFLYINNDHSIQAYIYMEWFSVLKIMVRKYSILVLIHEELYLQYGPTKNQIITFR